MSVGLLLRTVVFTPAWEFQVRSRKGAFPTTEVHTSLATGSPSHVTRIARLGIRVQGYVRKARLEPSLTTWRCT